ncbi:hypothetical protein [Scale drop disease virus]|uniref:Uncharacterized protein n=1 Tax=Scale drop disease virus TaxID=1697349 RepID=A0A7D5UL76_9VIRU|nr:hypothetical protein [Scale drop disease virus]QXJ13660.1 hypothetical protein PMJGCIOK_00093 [Scale drop disease virus]UNH60713.1 hypothetical protein SDDV_ORF044 [Scale drop disease virus]
MKKPYVTLKKLKDTGNDSSPINDSGDSGGGCINCKQDGGDETFIDEVKSMFTLSNIEIVAIAILIIAIFVFFWNRYSSGGTNGGGGGGKRPFPFHRDF